MYFKKNNKCINAKTCEKLPIWGLFCKSLISETDILNNHYVLFTQRALKCYSYESFDRTSIQMLMRHKLLSVLNI